VSTEEETNLAIFRELCANDAPKEGWQDAYRRTHHQDIIVNQPGRSEPITDLEEHLADVGSIVAAFPDLVLELPHRILFASGNAVCAITRFHGTMTGVLRRPDGTEFEPTGKRFDLDLGAVMLWRDGLMFEENLYWDLGPRWHDEPNRP
jgi:hypothetical protein